MSSILRTARNNRDEDKIIRYSMDCRAAEDPSTTDELEESYEFDPAGETRANTSIA